MAHSHQAAHPPHPKRSRASFLIPAFVGVVTIGLIAWVTWPTIRPVRSVTVTQVVFDRSITASEEIADPKGAGRSETPTVQAAGWLEAEPFSIACSALADGVVERIEVLEGDRVEAGQVVARLIDEDARLRLRRAQAEVATARAILAAEEADRVAAQRSWDEPVELERAVASGRASVTEAEAELDRLPAQIDAERGTLKLLQEELARVRQSAEQGNVNDLEVIVAEQRVLSQDGVVRAIKGRTPLLRARIDRLRAELLASERHLALRIADRRHLDHTTAAAAAAQGALQSAEAARDEAALELERMVIRAPISGYVQRRMKAPGDKVVRMMDAPDSAQILHLYDPDRLQVRVDVALADASHVSVGQRCEVVVEVLPDRTFVGEVLRITHEADLQKNTLQIKVKVIDPDPALRPEMLTRVKFLPSGSAFTSGGISNASRSTRVLVVTDAVESNAGVSRVWTIAQRRGDRGVLRAVPIEVLEESDGWTVVRGDLHPGALIAIETEGAREGETVALRTGEGGAGS